MSDNLPQHWLKRALRIVLWLLAAALPIVTAIFIAGPDAIRNFPKVPSAIRETASSMLYTRWLDNQLTGIWNNRHPGAHRPNPDELLSIELWVNDGIVDGTITGGTYIGKWRPKGMEARLPSYPTALLRGTIEDNSLIVEIFDFEDAKMVKFADLTIWFGEEDIGDFGAPTPDEVISELRVKTGWQISTALPQSFILFRTQQ